MQDNPPLLELRDVCKSYPSPGAMTAPRFRNLPPAIHVLRGVNLRLETGQSLAVVGVSGSGKSTLLNLIGALDRPTSGQVRIDGRDLSAMAEKELAALRNRRIGFVFQQHHLLPQCTALENVLVPTLATRGARPKELQEYAWELLRRVGLGDRAYHYPSEMSGGECQRVAVARALINQPQLLLADEPTGSLDSDSCNAMADLLCDAQRDAGVSPACGEGVLPSPDDIAHGGTPGNGENADKMSAARAGKMPATHEAKMASSHTGKMPVPHSPLAMIVVTHSMELARRMGKVMRLRAGTLVEAGDE